MCHYVKTYDEKIIERHSESNYQKRMSSRPKQQHYVTRAYLEQFLEPDQQFLFCYGRHRSPFQKRPADLASERSYYSFRRPDGTWDDSLEHEIERLVETPGLAVIRKLSSGNMRLNWAERDALSMLMAVQRLRVPHLRQMIDAAHAEMIQRLLVEHDQMQQEQGPGRMWIRHISPVARPGDAERSRAYVTKEELEEIQRSLDKDPGQFSRETLFSLATSFAKVFRRMKWTFYSNTDTPFITSDCPVLLWHEREDVKHAGMIRPDTNIEFPLSRTSLLSMAHDVGLMNRVTRLGPNSEARRILNQVPEIRIAQLKGEQVKNFNLRQAAYCSRWTFCGRENDELIDVLRERSKNVRHRFVRDGNFFRVESLTGEP